MQRLINQDRNSFAASMVALGHADGMVTGVTRTFDQVLEEVLRVIDPAPGGRMIGMIVVLAKGRTLFVADTNVTEMPEAEDLVEIAMRGGPRRAHAWATRRAWPSCPTRPSATRWASAPRRCARPSPCSTRWTSTSSTRARCRRSWRWSPASAANYPFMRLTGPANVLIMPAIHSAAISTQLVQSLGGATVIGPILLGLDQVGADLPAVGLGLEDPADGHGLRLRAPARGDREPDRGWRHRRLS